MKRYKILDTDSTRYFAYSLIGMMFEGEIQGQYINLHTCDGELLFAFDEVEEI
jgi:hypothetical protein